MSKRVLTALIVISFAAFGFGYDTVTDLIWNGDFESVNVANTTNGWVYYPGPNATVEVVQGESAGPGNQSLKITSNNDNVSAFNYYWPFGAPCEGGSAVHFEASYKTSGDINFTGAGSPYIQLAFWKEPDGGGLPGYPDDYLGQEYFSLSDTSEAWVTVSADTVAPEGTVYVRAGLGIPAGYVDAGSFYLDEVVLTGGKPFDAEFNWCKNGDAEDPEQFMFWRSTVDQEVMVRNDGAEGTTSSFGLDNEGAAGVSSRIEQMRNKKGENQRMPIEDPNGVLFVDFWYKTEPNDVDTSISYPGDMLVSLEFWHAADLTSLNDDNEYLGAVSYSLVETDGEWEYVAYIIDMSQLRPLNVITSPNPITHFVTKFTNGTANNGLVQFDQIRVLKKLPTTIIPDIQQIGTDWLSNGVLPMEPDFLVDDFEDPCTFVDNEWYAKSTSTNNFAPNIYLVNDPGNGFGGSDYYLRWDYTLSVGTFREFSRMFTLSELGGSDGIDLSIYDELRFQVYRFAGNSREGKMFNKFYTNPWGFDGEFSTIELTAARPQSDATGTTQTPAEQWDEWVSDLRALLSAGSAGENKMYESLPLITDCSGIMFGISSNDRFGGDLGSGTMLIDDIRFVQTVPRCDSTTSTMDADGDCDVDMFDVAVKAMGWLIFDE